LMGSKTVGSMTVGSMAVGGPGSRSNPVD